MDEFDFAEDAGGKRFDTFRAGRGVAEAASATRIRTLGVCETRRASASRGRQTAPGGQGGGRGSGDAVQLAPGPTASSTGAISRATRRPSRRYNRDVEGLTVRFARLTEEAGSPLPSAAQLSAAKLEYQVGDLKSL